VEPACRPALARHDHRPTRLGNRSCHVDPGIDLDARSVAHARARDPGVRFETCDLTRAATPAPSRSMDVTVAVGLLHHLSNLQARAMLGLAKQALRPGGRVGTIDPAFEPGQHPVAALLARADRGCFVRSGQAYYELARAIFPDTSAAECWARESGSRAWQRGCALRHWATRCGPTPPSCRPDGARPATCTVRGCPGLGVAARSAGRASRTAGAARALRSP